MNIENGKRAAAIAAVALIQDGMTVGIGSGSTVHFFIQELTQRCQKGLHIQALPSSYQSLQTTLKGGIPLLNPEDVSKLDITVDGADEIDPMRQMIKGGGGALLREKITASMSQQVVIIIDETKKVSQLGRHPLPIEIVRFGYQATMVHLKDLGFHGRLRLDPKGGHYFTDNGNYIYDADLEPGSLKPATDHSRLAQIPGVVETGIFINRITHLITGFSDGSYVVE